MQLCYGVQNAASATITPSPGNVKPVAKECVPVDCRADVHANCPQRCRRRRQPHAHGRGGGEPAAGSDCRGAERDREIARRCYRRTREGRPRNAHRRGQARAGRIGPGGFGRCAVAQGRRENQGRWARHAAGHAGHRSLAATVPSALPRVGDVWEYRSRSMWKNVEPSNYTHQINSVSEREVRETMSYTSAGSPPRASPSLPIRVSSNGAAEDITSSSSTRSSRHSVICSPGPRGSYRSRSRTHSSGTGTPTDARAIGTR